MAACSLIKSTGVSTNTTSYTQVVQATVGNLIIAMIGASATTGAASSTDNKGGTYTLISSGGKNSTGDTAYIYVGDSLVTTSSFTLNLGFTGDAGTGAAIAIFEVSGMTLSGASATKQQIGLSNQSTSVTPAVTFGGNVSSSNPTLGLVFNSNSASGVTAPTNWTLSTDLGFASPNGGMAVVFRDNTFNGTTVTWGSASASQYTVQMVELDTSTGGTTLFPHRTLLGVGI